MAALFISHSGEDDDATRLVVDRLGQSGYQTLFVDFDPASGIPPGADWERELFEQIRKADGLVFLSTPNSLASRWCFVELCLARAFHTPVFPVVVAGDRPTEFLAELQWVHLTDSRTDGFKHLLTGLDHAGLSPDTSFSWDPKRSPYPGLRAFDSHDAAVFFGRDSEATELIQRMQPPSSRERGRLLAVVGPSGSGKSSLIAARVLPRLARQQDQWKVADGFVPGSDPIAHLARALRGVSELSTDLSAIEAELRSGPMGLIRLARECIDSIGSHSMRLVLFMDQAEELVTRTAEGRAREFLALLHGALDSDSPISLIITLRAEFLNQFLLISQPYGGFDDTFVVGPIAPDQIPLVIEGPAHRVGLEFEPGLVQRMVHDTADSANLPLLAFTLRQLYERRRAAHPITHVDYDYVGGVVGGLQRHADGVLSQLTRTRESAAVLATLMKFVTLAPGGEPVRRRVRLDHLTSDEKSIAHAFWDARLLQSYQDDQFTLLEVSHEALLQRWPPLRRAVEGSRRTLEVRTDIENTSRAWDRDHQDESYLPRGAHLAFVAEDLGPAATEALPSIAQKFLSISHAYAERRISATRRTNRRLRRLAVGLIALLVAVGMVSGVAIYQQRAASSQHRIATARQLAAQAALTREADPTTALLLGIAARTLNDDGETRTSLANVLAYTRVRETLITGPDHVNTVTTAAAGGLMATAGFGGVDLWEVTDDGDVELLSSIADGALNYAAAISPDGATLAVGDAEQHVTMWDVSDPEEPIRLGTPVTMHSGSVLTLAFSPNGRILASGSIDKTVILWDVTDPAAPRAIGRPLGGHTTSVVSVRFSPSGRSLATAAGDTVRFWNVSQNGAKSGLNNWTPGVGDLESIAYSADGRMLVTTGGRRVAKLWNVERDGPPTLLSGSPGHTHRVSSAAFSPDGLTVATGSYDRSLRLWNIRNPRAPKLVGIPLIGHTNLVNSLAFSASGDRLFSGANGGSIIMWSTQDRVQRHWLPNYRGPDGRPAAIAYTASRKMLATGARDGSVSLWNLTDSAAPQVVGTGLGGHPGPYITMAFTSDGHTLATAGNDEVITIWDVSDPRKPHVRRSLIAPHKSVTIAFAPDATILASGDEEGTIALWDVAESAREAPLAVRDVKVPVTALTFSPSGQTLAAATDYVFGRVMMWNVTAPTQPTMMGDISKYDERVYSVAFSPDGNTLATGGDGSISLWNVSDPMQAMPYPTSVSGFGGPVRALAFSPHDEMLASGHEDGAIRLWDLHNPTIPTQLGPQILGGNLVRNVTFTDGSDVLATSTYFDAEVWDLSDITELREYAGLGKACTALGRGITHEEWARLVPDLDFEWTC